MRLPLVALILVLRASVLYTFINSMSACCIVYVTAPNPKEASKISVALVQERLAACVNVVPGIKSYYRWQGKIEKGRETLLIIKTKRSLIKSLVGRIKEMHVYSLPEVVALSVVDGSPEYLKWVQESVK